jgi:hypothetical protein
VKRILKALKGIKLDNKEVSVNSVFSPSYELPYILIYKIYDTEEDACDDDFVSIEKSYQVSFFTNKNPSSLNEEIRKRLKDEFAYQITSIPISFSDEQEDGKTITQTKFRFKTIEMRN